MLQNENVFATLTKTLMPTVRRTPPNMYQLSSSIINNSWKFVTRESDDQQLVNVRDPREQTPFFVKQPHGEKCVD